jgi:hypothetical protein
MPQSIRSGQSCRVHDVIADFRYSRISNGWAIQRKKFHPELSACQGWKFTRFVYMILFFGIVMVAFFSFKKLVAYLARVIAFPLFHTGEAVVMFVHQQTLSKCASDQVHFAVSFSGGRHFSMLMEIATMAGMGHGPACHRWKRTAAVGRERPVGCLNRF